MLNILMLEKHLNQKRGRYYTNSDSRQPMCIKELKYFQDVKVMQVFCTVEGLKFLYKNVPEGTVFNLAFPDNCILLEAQARLFSLELRCFWFSYHKLKRGTEGDILRIKLENFLKILQED